MPKYTCSNSISASRMHILLCARKGDNNGRNRNEGATCTSYVQTQSLILKIWGPVLLGSRVQGEYFTCTVWISQNAAGKYFIVSNGKLLHHVSCPEVAVHLDPKACSRVSSRQKEKSLLRG